MSILKAALCASLFLLTSCATPSSHTPLPSECVAVERAPPVPDGVGIVAPVTEKERSATRLFLNWVAEVVSIGEANADRLEDRLRDCGSRD